ncbi:MAG: hypothetical protein PHQ81_04390 [Methanofollis sp.]|nr:hypothetical protein [Methanofollis sp.]
MVVKALFLNCTLKYSPEVSNTGALIRKAVTLFLDLGVESEVVRVTDYMVRFGTSSDEGEGDEWPLVLQKIKDCDPGDRVADLVWGTVVGGPAGH